MAEVSEATGFVSQYTGDQIEQAISACLNGNTKTTVVAKVSATTEYWKTSNNPFIKYYTEIALSGSFYVGNYPDIFILDNNDQIDNTHYIFYGDCGYMNAYETDGSSISLYVTFFEIYTDYNKTNPLYYGLSLGNYNNHLQYILYANTTTNQEPSVAGLTQ